MYLSVYLRTSLYVYAFNMFHCWLLSIFLSKCTINYGTYRKRQKFSERKVSQFVGFHLKVGKTFAGLASSVLIESTEASHCFEKIHWETFTFCR